MLQQLPESAERNDKELQIQLDLAGYLNNRSFGDPGRARALQRARELSEQSGDSAQLLLVLWQLCQYFLDQMEIRSGLETRRTSFRFGEQQQQTGFWSQAQSTTWERLRSGTAT
jgi:hypothetical protein